MRFHFFPTPAEGETIYSGFCRCAERSGLPQNHIASYLTGQRNILPFYGALPGYLKTLASSLPTGHPWTNPKYSIRLHTALPYYTYFDSPIRRNKTVQVLANNDFSYEVGLALGLSHYRCGAAPKHPRFCIECNKEGQSELGFSYFRREHQLPGVIICWKHGCLLSHGCRNCGPYPIPRRGLRMPGHCLCAGEQLPLPVIEELPGDPAILKWLASESAYMVSADGTQCPCVQTELLRQAVEHGLCRGSLPVFADIATALESRFGLDILTWLGYPPWTNGRPSAWMRRLLRSTEKRKKPTIIFLLLLGLFHASVEGFEAAAQEGGEKLMIEKSVGASEWQAKLPRLLASHSFSVMSVAHRIGVSKCIVAAEARKQGVRVPIPDAITAKLGQEKIENIRSDLQVGIAMAELKKKYRASWWDLKQIGLATPGIHDAWKRAVAQRKRDEHRQRVVDLKTADRNASRNKLAETSPATYQYMLNHDNEWFDQTLPSREQLSRAAWGPPLPFLLELVEPHSDWRTQLPQLFAAHSYELAAVASRIGVSQERILTEALKQGIRVSFSNELAIRLGQENLESIRSDLCAGIPKHTVAKKHGISMRTIRLIELDTPGILDIRKSTAARKIRTAHRQRVLDLIASDPNASRSMIMEKVPKTYSYVLERDRKWFEKTLPKRTPPDSQRGSRFDRDQFDSELAEKVTHIISELKSASHPVRITKHGVLGRAGCLVKYWQFSADLPKTQALINENVETIPAYRVRRIRWAIAEMARNGQAITGKTVRRKAGLSTTLLHEYKQLVLETAQKLGVNVGSRSFFARE